LALLVFWRCKIVGERVDLQLQKHLCRMAANVVTFFL
jgi:hypothetical protein